MENIALQFGLTQPTTCSYLHEQQEQLAVLIGPEPIEADTYSQLIAYNFRRSGDQIYRPHCADCSACQSLRILVSDFQPSAAQRRILNKAQRERWHYKLSDAPQIDSAEYTELFALFSRYIAFKHADSVMFPATDEQLHSLLHSYWQPIRLLKLYQADVLMAVSIIDDLSDSFSAVYTFFAAEGARFSPGKLAILYLLDFAATTDRRFVYLGYQIEGCKKMAYKSEFRPHQRFFNGYWHSFA
ncbi:arginyltransferase [Alishewanella sp. SMS8]|uniref:arginyltransferase n=1 Tax=Alishewanella sp. SMS8 TaxID=2994676 RepID=UPI0027419A1F|nr:arginyltransferase [Alishewanella sp. SMS8]MDP5457987.1 arginyltransferase [Alishewanella sp. SMS8]